MTMPPRMMNCGRTVRKKSPGIVHDTKRAAAGLLSALLALWLPVHANDMQPLRLMAFNIEWGGTHVSFGQVVAAIRAAEPDVVVVQEAEGNLARLAGELGWHFDLANHVVSRFELVEPDADSRWLWVETAEGRGVAVANVHLPSDPYGEHWIREGRPREDVLALERRLRLPAIEPFLEALAPLVERDVPVFLAGDFNSPSHLDWTAAALERWPERSYPVRWPVSLAAAAAGFRDAWRTAHPDVATHPGFTWWAARPRIRDYNPDDDSDWQSRIDFVHVAGPVEVSGARLVGEQGAAAIEIEPWPSDHRAVVVDTRVRPAVLPPYVVAAGPRVTAGKPVSIRYRNAGERGTLRIAGEGGGDRVLELREGAGRMAQVLPEGRFRLELADAAGRPLADYRLAVLAPGAAPSVDVMAARYPAGAPVTVRWDRAPGNRYDWLALYRADATDADAWLAWRHTGAAIDGVGTLGPSEAGDRWPLPAGRYVVRLLEDDGQTVLAESAPFSIGPGD